MLDSPPEISSAVHGPSPATSGRTARSHGSTAAAGSPGRSGVMSATGSAMSPYAPRGALGDRHPVHFRRAVVDAERAHVGVDAPDHHLLGGAEAAAQLHGAVH